MPVLKAEKALAALATGQTLVLLATDPVARIDIPVLCRKLGHALTFSEDNGVQRFEIVKNGAT